jgi:hypothetical protein
LADVVIAILLSRPCRRRILLASFRGHETGKQLVLTRTPNCPPLLCRYVGETAMSAFPIAPFCKLNLKRPLTKLYNRQSYRHRLLICFLSTWQLTGPHDLIQYVILPMLTYGASLKAEKVQFKCASEVNICCCG